MAEGAELVVAHFDEIVKPDGGSVRILAREGGVLRVAYASGANEDCPTCILEPDALADMMKDLMRDHEPGITEIVIEEVASAG